MERSRKRKGPGIGWAILLSLLALIVIIRLLLPAILLRYVNNELDKNEAYNGKVGGIGLSIIAGSYSFNDVVIYDATSEEKEPLFQVKEARIDIDYKTLFKKQKILAELELDKPVLNFVQRPAEEPAPEDVEEDLQKTINDLIPVTIERFRINDGKVSYRDLTSKPVFAIDIWAINLTAKDLSTLPAGGEMLPSSLTGNAIATGDGNIDFTARFDPWANVPTFDLNFELQGLKLTAYSGYVKEAANLFVTGGTFNLHTEIAAHDGFFTGYAKPLIDSLKISPLNPEESGPLQKLYESAAKALRDILEAPKEEQIGLRIPIEGTFENPEASIWTAIITLLKNAFIEALVPSIDHSINIGQVQEVIQDKIEERK